MWRKLMVVIGLSIIAASCGSAITGSAFLIHDGPDEVQGRAIFLLKENNSEGDRPPNSAKCLNR